MRLANTLKRPADPTGKTVPPDLALDTPDDFAKLLPLRLPHLRPGDELPGRPGWRLEELLGAGGFGEVWLARHSFLPHPRAVKFCTDAKVRAKLTSHEGRVIARAFNQVELLKDATAHAEMLAVTQAEEAMGERWDR